MSVQLPWFSGTYNPALARDDLHLLSRWIHRKTEQCTWARHHVRTHPKPGSEFPPTRIQNLRDEDPPICGFRPAWELRYVLDAPCPCLLEAQQQDAAFPLPKQRKYCR